MIKIQVTFNCCVEEEFYIIKEVGLGKAGSR